MTGKLQSRFNMIVYIGEFDKKDSQGRLMCRNTPCNNYPVAPYRKYCSRSCNREFRRWYYHNFYWERVRSDIFRRDNYTCQICNQRYPVRYRSFIRTRNLECDHIIPRSLYEEHGYRCDSLENKVKTTLEFLHNHNNLRTLCRKCHKTITSKYLSGKKKSSNSDKTLKP
jgi:5-methylcytosine-specific restriction endonuclease McrA